MGYFLDLGDYNRCAAVAWAGSSGSAAAAASPGAKPHRARQGYAGGIRTIGSMFGTKEEGGHPVSGSPWPLHKHPDQKLGCRALCLNWFWLLKCLS
jgi:hypothetical protein